MAGYIIYVEIMKPRSFKAIRETTKEELKSMEKTRDKGLLKTLGWIVAAPFIGLAFVVALPFAFLGVIGIAALSNIVTHKGMSFGWRPMEAYLAGRKKRKREKKRKDNDHALL